jgi:hypothetical protein
MDPSQIRISADPITAALCRFTVDRPVYPNESFYFGNKERAQIRRWPADFSTWKVSPRC